MSSKQQIIDLAVQGADGVNRGRAMAIKSRLDRPDIIHSTRTQSQRTFLGQVLAQGRPERAGAYDHPARRTPRGVDRNLTELSASDLAWLNRLPQDPAAVTVEDAATLSTLARQLRRGHAKQGDRRLVESIWTPIRALHDRAEAEHNLRLAERAVPEVSSAAVSAVAEAMQNDDPSLDPEFATIQAERELHTAHSAQIRQRVRAIESAQRSLTDPTAARYADTD